MWLAAGLSQSSGRAGIWCRADMDGIFFAARACHRSVTGPQAAGHVYRRSDIQASARPSVTGHSTIKDERFIIGRFVSAVEVSLKKDEGANAVQCSSVVQCGVLEWYQT